MGKDGGSDTPGNKRKREENGGMLDVIIDIHSGSEGEEEMKKHINEKVRVK